jgi:hypothetical protein
MYLSHSAFEVAALSNPKPAWVPGVGGTLYVGYCFIVKKPITDAAMTPIPFKVGQITDATTSTELKVNWFTTGDSIRDYAGGENNYEEDMCYIAVKTNIYQQVSTSDICSLAYLVHADNKQKLLVDPKGLPNTFTVDRQLILGCNPAVVPVVNKELVSCAVDVFQKTYPNLSSMPCRMFEARRAVSVTGFSMLSRQTIAQALQNTRSVHIDKSVWTIINGYLFDVLNNLSVKVPTCDSVVTTNFRQVKVLFNDDVEITSTKYRDNSQKANKKLLYTKEQVSVLKEAFGKDFGVGCRSPFPLASLTNNLKSNHVCESRVVDDTAHLNSVMTVPHQGELSPTQVLCSIPRAGGPNGVCLTYQGLNNSLAMGMRFARARAGNMSDVVDEVECNTPPLIAQQTKFTMLRQMKKIKEASHYLAQTIRHSLLIVSIIMVDNLKLLTLQQMALFMCAKKYSVHG